MNIQKQMKALKPMSDYLLRKKGINRYAIAKFEDSDSPIDVYNITSGKCSCPSRYANCKHSKLLKIWKQKEEPLGVIYDDLGNVTGSVFGDNLLL